LDTLSKTNRKCFLLVGLSLNIIEKLFFRTTVPLESGISNVRICVSVFTIFYAYSENMLKVFYRRRRIRPKVFNRIWRMQQKSLSVHRDFGDLRGVLFMRSHLRIRQKHFCVHGDCAYLGEFSTKSNKVSDPKSPS
jgi:hypothetical protein